MSSYLLNGDGDLDITNNSLSLTHGIDAIRQHLFVKFRLFLGEWFLDTSVGVPWFQEIFVKAPIFTVVHERLKAVILETPGVLSLKKFLFDLDEVSREAALDFSAQTIEGDIDFSQIVEI